MSGGVAVESQRVQIEVVTTNDRFDVVDDVFRRVWGTDVPTLGRELLHVVAFAGGYVTLAHVDGSVVGASVALRSVYRGAAALHSHATGVLAGARGLHVGTAMKTDQRQWAAAQGIANITWTFDPLVRRNAWFNLGRLGAQVTEYHVDFYGEMTDAINAGDESDRLVAVWPTDETIASRPVVDPGVDDVLIPTPEDIESLRVDDLPAALEWRFRLREQLQPHVNSASVVGFTRDGSYVVRVAPDREIT